MNDNELLDIWKSYDQKLDNVLSLNKQMARDLTKDRLNKTINKLKYPMRFTLLIGLPYTVLLYFITFIAFKAGSPFVFIGFGIISLIMALIIGQYIYHLHLISEINKNQNIMEVQENISKLKIATFNTTKLALVQIPFWSICWVSLEALKDSPYIYGGVNLVVFLALAYLAYWLYKNLNIQNLDSKINKFFFSGPDWDPIIKSSHILEQIKELEQSEND